jgi:glycerophosphoryl diester phosphodiesterase
MRVISHRCKGFGERENSAEALRAALRSTVDEVELDFRVTIDGDLVASHFALFLDFKNRPRTVSLRGVAENQLSGLMSLEECLTIFSQEGAGKRLRLEIKSGGAERRVIELLERFGLLERVVLASWRVDILKRLRAMSSTIELSLSFIMGLQGGWPILFAWPTSVPRALCNRDLRIGSVVVVSGVFSLTEGYVSKLRRHGIEVFTIARGDGGDLERLVALGVTGAMFSGVSESLHAARDHY